MWVCLFVWIAPKDTFCWFSYVYYFDVIICSSIVLGWHKINLSLLLSLSATDACFSSCLKMVFQIENEFDVRSPVDKPQQQHHDLVYLICIHQQSREKRTQPSTVGSMCVKKSEDKTKNERRDIVVRQRMESITTWFNWMNGCYAGVMDFDGEISGEHVWKNHLQILRLILFSLVVATFIAEQPSHCSFRLHDLGGTHRSIVKIKCISLSIYSVTDENFMVWAMARTHLLLLLIFFSFRVNKWNATSLVRCNVRVGAYEKEGMRLMIEQIAGKKSEREWDGGGQSFTRMNDCEKTNRLGIAEIKQY